MELNLAYLSSRLSKIPLSDLGSCVKLFKRTPRKLTVYNLVLSFYRSVFDASSKFSFSTWALQASILLGEVITKQALSKLAHQQQVYFAKLLLSYCLKQRIKSGISQVKSSDLFGSFNRVLLQDSTSIHLPKTLCSIFKGSSKKGGQSSSARIQCIYELKQSCYLYFKLNSYHLNDLTAVGQVLNLLKKGDLIIRDLGYFKLSIFRQIDEAKAFFLSRMSYNVTVFCPQTDQRIDLYDTLQNRSYFDQMVVLAANREVRVRLVAIKLPEHVVEQRKRKLNQKRKTDNRKRYDAH